nr:hypothetical protein [Rhizobium phaseoli]
MKVVDSIFGQTLRAIFSAIAHINQFALGDIVRVGGHLLDEFEVLADHAGDFFQRIDEP